MEKHFATPRYNPIKYLPSNLCEKYTASRVNKRRSLIW